jgi:predicted phosphodiesterase
MPRKPDERPPAIPSAAQVAITAFACGLVALAILGLVPASNHDLGPTVVGTHGAAGRGRTVLTIPPLGTIEADTHPVPLRLEMSVGAVNFERLGSLATTASGRQELLREVEVDLRQLLVDAVLRMTVGAAIIGAVVAAVVWRRNWRRMAAGAAGGIIVVSGAFAATAFTFDIDALEEPKFTGTLARAPVVFDAVRTQVGVLDELRTRYETASERLSNLLVLMAEPDLDPQRETTAILHVSDIHANPIGIEIADQLAREFEVDAILDTGDFASAALDTGELTTLAGPLDRRLSESIGDIPVPYYFVRGNHDSALLLQTLGAEANVTIVDREVVDIDGVEVLGWPDPTFSTVPQSASDEIETRLAEAPEVASAVTLEQPDVLAVHDDRLATESIGLVATVLAGHLHQRVIREEEGTVSLIVGSTGAAGVNSLLQEADQPYEAEIVYFRAGVLAAVDYITFTGIGSDFVIERKTFAAPEDEETI